MASKEQCDRYAAELAERFEDFTKWAIANWPRKEFPLLPSDFNASHKEIGHILGPKLGDCKDAGPPSADNNDSEQYVDMNPMPWP